MPILESQIDRNSDEFKQNRERMRAAIAEFREAEASVQAASEKSRERFAKRRQLMPREGEQAAGDLPGRAAAPT
jgi:geranyl-CoA carboxylase beta subunit